MLKDYLVAEDDKALAGDYKYDLVANIVHDGSPNGEENSYLAHIYHKVPSFFFLLRSSLFLPSFLWSMSMHVDEQTNFSLQTEHTVMNQPNLSL